MNMPDIRHAPRLLDQVRQAIRLRHFSWRTEQAYVQRINRFILFHHKQHPRETGAMEEPEHRSEYSIAVSGH